MAQQSAPGTYGQILRSSALIGGASLVNVVTGIVRVKLMAMLLGPAGVGLFGAFGAIVDLSRTVAEMGITRSGVRQIAAASGSGDANLVAQTATVLRRTAIILALLGAIGLALLSAPVAMLSFGDHQRTGAVVLLSLAVFFTVLAGAQGALLQGLRRIGDLARMGIWGGVLGTAISVATVFAFGEDGVALALVGVAAMSLLTAWWYGRRVQLTAVVVSTSHARHEAASLLKLGLAFMASGLLTMGAAYAVRVIVLRSAGLEAAGLYQAAWTLGGLYVAFILQAMGTDFYPRLVGVITDHPVCNRVVNEQTHVSLLLAGPGVIATLALAPQILDVFYTASFSPAVDALRWICLGMALRMITWPMGFIVVAKNHQLVFFGIEAAWTVVNVGLSWYAVQRFGLAGAGIAFFGSYVFHGLLLYPIVRRLTGFRWSAATHGTGVLFLSCVAAVFCASQVLPARWALAFGGVMTLLSAAHSLRSLNALVSPGDLPGPVLRVMRGLRTLLPAWK